MTNATADSAPRTSRRWPTLAGVIAAACIIAAVTSGAGGDRVTTAILDLASLASAGLACGLCVRATRVDAGHPWGWRLLVAATALWTAGELLWSIPEVVLDEEVAFPSWADLAYLGAVPFAVAGLLWLSRGKPTHERLRTALDGCLMGGSLLFVSWALVLGPIWRTGGGVSLGHLVEVAYPVTDILMATVAILVWRVVPAAQRRGLRAMAAGFIAMAMTDGVYTWMVNTDTFSSASAIGLGWPVGYLLVALAAWRAVQSESHVGDAERQTRFGILLPYIPLLVAGIVALHRIVTDSRPLGAFLTITGLGLLAMVLVRQALVAFDLHHTVIALDEREAELRRLALHDPLTGLANRAYFATQFDRAVAREGSRPALLYIDLDGFKQVNDRFGHAIGDALLVATAHRLSGCIGEGMTVARLGGDEFVIMVGGGQDAAAEVASRIVDALTTAIHFEGETVAVSASIGLAEVPAGCTLDDAVRRADAAMYVAKASGKGRAVRYPDETFIVGDMRPS